MQRLGMLLLIVFSGGLILFIAFSPDPVSPVAWLTGIFGGSAVLVAASSRLILLSLGNGSIFDNRATSSGDVALTSQEVGDERNVPFGGSLIRNDTLVGRWGSLVINAGERIEDFRNYFSEILKSRELSQLKIYDEWLSTSGVFAASRPFLVIEQNWIRMAIYSAKQGKDLYISWRLYIIQKFTWIPVVVWLVLSLVVGVILGIINTSIGVALVSFFLVFIVLGFLGAFWGQMFMENPFGLLLVRFHEMNLDDAEAASIVVQASIEAAIEKMGIEDVKLEPRSSIMRQPRRRRI